MVRAVPLVDIFSREDSSMIHVPIVFEQQEGIISVRELIILLKMAIYFEIWQWPKLFNIDTDIEQCYNMMLLPSLGKVLAQPSCTEA